MPAMKTIILSIVMVLAGTLACFAEYYKYRDANGVLHFSDTLPEKYADQAKTYQESVTTSPLDVKPKKLRETTSPLPSQPHKKSGPTYKETKITIQKNRILLPVEIVGTRGRAIVHLIMDTGAQRTFLWRTALPSIGLRKVGRVRAAGIAGSKYASFIRVKSLNVGPYRLRNAVVTLMDPGKYNTGYDGLLGMDFLMRVKYEIDYNRGVIIWKGKH
jgi:predicted aspartyl protease